MDNTGGAMTKTVECNDCKVSFNPSSQGIVGKVDGKVWAYCKDCCAKEKG